MKKIIAIILVLQMVLVNGAVYAQEEEVTAPKPDASLSASILQEDGPKKSLKEELDYRDPSSYPLIGKGELAGLLVDSYSGYQYIFFEETTTSPYNVDDMDINLIYASDDAYLKDRYLNIEFYTEEANTLNHLGNISYNTYGYDAVYLGASLAKNLYSDKPYIYMRLGIYKNTYDTYYSDVVTFKVANPFYSSGTPAMVDSYAVISNESTNASSAEPTGTFSLKNMNYTMDKSLKPSAYKVDYNKPFDVEGNEGKLSQSEFKSINPSYNKGDYKNFWVTNIEYNYNYQINARLAYSGTKADIWVYNNQISDLDAEKLGKEFDDKIHSSVTNNFGRESDVNADGKINILTFDIQDGFSGSGGYVGGYFWSGDLYNVSGSNQSEIFYIDTYPSMGTTSVKDVTSAYGTLAHEFQHMVNFNQNVLIERSNSNMDTWLNEALSMAAEQVYSGQGISDRVDYYNVSSSIQNGHSLLYWDNYGDLLSNYSLSYLFGQYIKIQTNQGNNIFKEILTDPNNDYKAIENVAKKYISPDMTFGKLMTNFRIALLLKESTGLYGFKGDPFFNALEEKIYTGNSANLRGGGAIVTTFNSAEGLEVPSNKGANVTYTFLDMNEGPGEVDTTPPAKPTVNAVSDKDSVVTGQAEAGSKVDVKVNGAVIATGTTGADGQFTVKIPVQSAGTELVVTATDQAGNVSTETIVVVQDVTAPAKPTVNEVSDKDSIVTGQAEAGSKVDVKVNGAVIGTGTAGADGKFSVGIPVQSADTELVITATDQAGNVSTATIVVVNAASDVTAPAKPTVNTVTDKDNTVTGQAEAGSKVKVTVNGAEIGSGTAGTNGQYTVAIPVQKAGTELLITATDQAGNISAATKVVVTDVTAPVKPAVNAVTDYETVLMGSAEPKSTIIAKVSGKEIGRSEAVENGSFAITIPIQPAGKIIEVFAVDAAGNISTAVKVTVNNKLQTLIGDTRYSTAVKVAQTGWKTTNTVLLVNGGAIVDGLTATPLASAKDAPILLTRSDSLPPETRNELTRLQSKEIILIGGTNVISAQVENQLKSMGFTLKRIGGSDRYETSLLIAKELDKLVDVGTAFVAYGRGEPDALSIAAQAGLQKQPIILTDKMVVPAQTLNWLKTEGLNTAYFIGGTTVIDSGIITEFNKITIQNVSANRISGADRHETNAKVISKFYPQSELLTILLAKSGTESLVDALTAGPLAAKMKSPVLLVSQWGIQSSQKAVLSVKHSKYVHQVGGGINSKAVNEVVE
nr:Ig-like domain-containing protein [Neobacillus sp. Marseille-Q6967]